jgi:hypothetical protein
MDDYPKKNREMHTKIISEEPEWSSRTEQSYRLERDRLIARNDYP